MNDLQSVKLKKGARFEDPIYKNSQRVSLY